MLQWASGDLFTSGAPVLVNAVNCRGVMGAGIALVYKRRWPNYFGRYVLDCHGHLVLPGRAISYWHEPKDLRPPYDDSSVIVNVATKYHWSDPSTLGWVQSGAVNLRRIVEEELLPEGHSRIAVPALGCGFGGLSWEDVEPILANAFETSVGEFIVYAPHDS